jgi:hypothetical protein
MREAILTKIQFSSTVHLSGCFQFDTLNIMDDLKLVSKLTIFPCLRLILPAVERDVFVSRLHSPSRTLISLSAEVDGSLADSLPARNAIADFTFM